MDKIVIILAVGLFSILGEAEQLPAYKNLKYISLEKQKASCATIGTQSHPESIECLYFEHSVRSPRESSSGMAEGRRSSARLEMKAIDPGMVGRIAQALKNSQNDLALRLWKEAIKHMARLRTPVDLNEQMTWIAREAFLKNDPELDHRLKDLASTTEAKGLIEDQVVDYERSLQACHQTPNCPAHEIHERLIELKESLNQVSSQNEMAMIKLQSAISARAQLIQLISNMLASFNETTKQVIGNMGGDCSSEPCRKKSCRQFND